MRGYYHSILALYNKHNGAQKKALTTQITLNLANLQEVLKRGLQPNYPDLADTIRCAMQLNCFHRVTMSSSTILIDAIPHMFPHLRDHRLEVAYITEKLSTPAIHKSISAPEVLVSEAISHLQNLNDPVLECESS
jgi:hypothetical protein